MLRIKNNRVDTSSTAALLKGFRAGTKDCRDRKTITPEMMRQDRISFLENGPISALSCLAFSLSPGMVAFSGLHRTMIRPQMRNTMSQPIGNM